MRPMVVAASQAAAEYMGVMIANGLRSVGGAARDAVRWSEDNLWVLGLGLLGLVLLRKLFSRRRSP